MIKEDKELLLKDLCARLPYEVEVHIKGEYKTPRTIYAVRVEDKTIGYFKGLHYNEELIENVKPYLRPMLSMTEEEVKELAYTILQHPDLDAVRNWITLDISSKDLHKCIDWLNAHHFDYRGLIDKCLALEAPKGMY